MQRNPEQLPNILLSLLQIEQPHLDLLLSSQAALEQHLTQTWTPTDPATWDDDDGFASDSFEASEAAEILPMVEAKLGNLEHPQRQTIKAALLAICPACRGDVSLLM